MKERVAELDKYLKRLFPLNRSLTGNGNRKTLSVLQELIPLKVLELASGTEVYDWRIPKEWKITDAWIKDSKGDKIVDFQLSPLHVVGYSAPIHKTLSFIELKDHLHYLEKLPEAIPYRTSYYNEDWGFCLSFNDYKENFHDGENYEVYIGSELFEGTLSMGELLIEGKSKKEYLVSSYICHPSMANDSLSGVLCAAFLAQELLKRQETLNYSYRFVFVPETIGAIAYCATHEKEMINIDSGFVMTTCGGPGAFGYKQSWQKEHTINHLIEEVFRSEEITPLVYPFEVRGSDERQYASQAFRINTITVTKDKYYEYDYYHTSLDNLDFVKAQHIDETLDIYIKLVEKLDKQLFYRNTMPYGEVMLSKHDLYPKMGGAFNQLIEEKSGKSELDIILELLFYADGKHSISELSHIIEVEETIVQQVAEKLVKKSILEVL